MSKTLVSAAKVVSLDSTDTEGSWILIDGERIAALGSGDTPTADRHVTVEGVILPGFVDAHLHLTTTGLYERGLDFRECRSVQELTEHIARGIGAAGDWVVGGNFDPGRNSVEEMPTRQALDSVAPNKPLMVSRADGHSCSVNSAALDEIDLPPNVQGVDLGDDSRPNGILRNKANYEARRRFFARIPPDEVRRAQKAACDLALAKGVTSVHEMAGGSYMGDRDFELLLEAMQELPINIEVYLSTLDISRVLKADLDKIGGDLFLDGSIGSKTAAMTEPYEDSSGSGSLYHEDEEIIAFYVEASRAGLQTGVHAIGDAAIEQALRCLEAAVLELGPEPAVGASRLRHRIEHFECVSAQQLSRAARLGVVASVQPMFDGYWGGQSGLYAKRLGTRSAAMNPFSEMLKVGLMVAGGSDSTVTPLNPLLGIQACVNHHEASSRVSIDEALRMFTIWGASAARAESERGTLEPGKTADLVVLSSDPRQVAPEAIAEIEILETWVAGTPAFPANQRSPRENA